MHRHAQHVALAALLFIAACSKTNNNVGTITHDSGAGGQTSQAGDATTASGGAGGHTIVSTGGTTVLGGSSGSGGGNSAASCLYKGVTYALGESFKDDCNTCMCGRFGDAVVSCTAMACGDGSVGPSVDTSTGGTSGAPSTGGVFGSGGSGAGGAQGGGGSIDAPLDGPMDTEPVDSDGCPAPDVWRYEQPGCDGQVQPICGSATQDACLGYACGCDGVNLGGCDFYGRPFRSKGLCPGTCFSPTQNLQLLGNSGGLIEGCACDATTDQPQCVSIGASYALNFTCVGGVWTVKDTTSCGG